MGGQRGPLPCPAAGAAGGNPEDLEGGLGQPGTCPAASHAHNTSRPRPSSLGSSRDPSRLQLLLLVSAEGSTVLGAAEIRGPQSTPSLRGGEKSRARFCPGAWNRIAQPGEPSRQGRAGWGGSAPLWGGPGHISFF